MSSAVHYQADHGPGDVVRGALHLAENETIARSNSIWCWADIVASSELGAARRRPSAGRNAGWPRGLAVFPRGGRLLIDRLSVIEVRWTG